MQIAHTPIQLAKHMLNLELGVEAFDPRDPRPPGKSGSSGVERPRIGAAPYPIAPDPQDPRGAPGYRVHAVYGVVMFPPGVDPSRMSVKERKRLFALLDGAGRDHLATPRATAASPYATIMSNSHRSESPDVVEPFNASWNGAATDDFKKARMFRFWRTGRQNYKSIVTILDTFVPTCAFTWHFVPFETYNMLTASLETPIVLPVVTILNDFNAKFDPPRIPHKITTQDLRVLNGAFTPPPVPHIGIDSTGALILEWDDLPPVMPTIAKAVATGKRTTPSSRCWLCRCLVRHHFFRFTADKKDRTSCVACWREFCKRWPREKKLPEHQEYVSPINAALAAGDAPQRLQEGVYFIPGVAILVPISGAGERLYNIEDLGAPIKFLIKYRQLGFYERGA